MNPLKKLAGETAIYGVSSILGRLLNWLLVPLYTNIFVESEYGIVTNLMAYVAMTLVILTYGLETGFFRYANDDDCKSTVFSTTFLSVTTTSLLFLLGVFFFLNPISSFLNVGDHSIYIILLALTLAFDAITSLPFAKLRQENRPLRYAFIKLSNIGINLGLNLLFLVLCPKLNTWFPEWGITRIWNPDIGIGYIFIAMFVASLFNLILLLPDLLKVKWQFDMTLLRKVLKYASPILVVSIAAQINLNVDKMLMPKLISDASEALAQTGIYGANFKLAVIMTLFIQAFRFAFEPFFFSQSKDESSKKLYADILKYFMIFGLLIFLGVMFYLDIVKILIGPKFHAGLDVVPIVLLANLFLGIFFSLSLWYKLTDKTRLGAYIALGGAAITLMLNIILVPSMGYYGAAIAILVCSVLMTITSYILGQIYYPIPYNLKRIATYFGLGMLLYFFSTFIQLENHWLKMLVKTPLIILFLMVVFQKEKLWTLLRKKG
ncbi:O-antigen/teichoic acid export membrane protein [Ancylomarina subtilis]|uniref:O-antigen/teichoic acid export membrane protein n=1 Tax=Ancylomarina subtilis TaxID=1639035 RepID=A0A4Q7VMJ0_9BACT|nr:oligosaccharide flippase family protein [Ancylomarina subtilis]RZT97540.1 O-antigen/teichoic acid export membrane protein [Ancylomarina subtilis]